MSFLILVLILGISFVQAQIPIDCKNEENGFTYPGKDCRHFFICTSGNAIEKECSYGLHYDDTSKNCLLPADIPTGECSLGEFCQKMAQNEHIPHANCHSYYTCVQKKPVYVECPGDMNYDYEHKICTVPHNINDNSVCYAPPDLCKNHDDSKTFPHKDVTKYYLCVQGKTIILSCGVDHVYDEKVEHCVEKKK